MEGLIALAVLLVIVLIVLVNCIKNRATGTCNGN